MPLDDSDPSVLPRPLPETTKSGDGDLVDIGQDDLVPREKRRLGDYLAYQTQQVFKNEYPIRPGSTPFRIRTASGNPVPISDVDENAVKTYMDTFSEEGGQKARSTFESLSDSGMLDTDTRFFIKKGKSDSVNKTGTEIFREIDELGGEADVPKRVEAVMLANNRFTEKTPAFIAGQTEGRGNSMGSLIVQPSLGSHVPQKFPKTVDGGQFVSIGIDKLKNFGYITMLEASGEINVPTDLENPDQLLGAAASALIPGLARIGQRVSTTRFDGVKILSSMEPTFKKSIRDDTLASNAILSYGNVNNPLAPFNGLVAASSISSAALLSLAVVTMVKSLYVAMNGLDEASKSLTGKGFLQTAPREPSKSRALRLGNYYGKDDDSATYRSYRDNVSLDLVVTKYPYFECVNRGIDVFFDAENKSTGGAVLGTTTSILQSHGYFNVVFRNLVRSSTDLLLNLVKPATDLPSAYDIDPNLGGLNNAAVDTISNAVGYVKIMNESKVLKFMNILALIGESSFLDDDSGSSTVDTILDVDPNAPVRNSPKLGILHVKSRLSDTFGNRLAWGGNTVQSMYLLPAEIKTAASRWDGDDTRFSAMTPARGFKTVDGNRISQADVKIMEDYLEADYMPFYFHDLRTNEIIAFHAFLDSIADNYSVDYTETEGYGRIGKVLTYKNTNRNISLSFAVVANDGKDFDEMWFKINKLISMLYPQYTQGRSLSFGGDSFVQPFSQLPGASPMIRLRLGDIFKSNYNKFDLARIFGVSSPDFFLEASGQRTARQTQDRERLDSKITEITNRMNAKTWQVNDRVMLAENWTPSGGRAQAPRQTTYQRKPTAGASLASRTRAQREEQRDLALSSRVPVRVLVVEGVQMPRGGGEGVEIQIASPVGSEQQGTFIVPKDKLSLIEAEVSRMAAEQTRTDDTDNSARQQDTSALQEFFSVGESPNPIFKSFESVRGRGLAGFIKSFNMDIDKSIQWETIGINNRAPKMLKISMEFAPIHDLQPGLDHNGFNSAPVYNVGEWEKQATRDDSQSEQNNRDAVYNDNVRITTNRDGTRGSS